MRISYSDFKSCEKALNPHNKEVLWTNKDFCLGICRVQLKYSCLMVVFKILVTGISVKPCVLGNFISSVHDTATCLAQIQVTDFCSVYNKQGIKGNIESEFVRKCGIAIGFFLNFLNICRGHLTT